MSHTYSDLPGHQATIAAFKDDCEKTIKVLDASQERNGPAFPYMVEIASRSIGQKIAMEDSVAGFLTGLQTGPTATGGIWPFKRGVSQAARDRHAAYTRVCLRFMSWYESFDVAAAGQSLQTPDERPLGQTAEFIADFGAVFHDMRDIGQNFAGLRNQILWDGEQVHEDPRIHTEIVAAYKEVLWHVKNSYDWEAVIANLEDRQIEEPVSDVTENYTV